MPSTEPQPTLMKMPANIARGIHPSAWSRGPESVPRVINCRISASTEDRTHAEAQMTDALLDDAHDSDFVVLLVLDRVAHRDEVLDLDDALAIRHVDRDVLGDAERLGVERRLRDQTVRRRQAEDAADEDDDAEEGEVPVEAGRALDGEVAGLRHDRRDAGRSASACELYTLVVNPEQVGEELRASVERRARHTRCRTAGRQRST